MKAVGLYRYLPISDPESLVDVEIEKPSPTGRDLLVKVEAISVNPVDVKVRAPKEKVETAPRILGWDAAGTVEAVGSDGTMFKPGDKVYYAGSIARPGCDSEFHLVDERIVGTMPKGLSFAEAAALPLTTLTAWEALFDRLGIARNGRDEGKSLLIFGGAGGVGSIAIQLAKELAKLKVIATASRPESEKWCRDLGSDEVIDHTQDLAPQLARVGVPQPEFIFCCNNTDQYFDTFAQIIAPEGKICSIVETHEPHNIYPLMSKSATFVWELMFTRSMYGTPDMIEQHKLLNAVSMLMDEGRLRTTASEVLGPINAANLRKAHEKIETGRTIGKVVLSGW